MWGSFQGPRHRDAVSGGLLLAGACSIPLPKTTSIVPWERIPTIPLSPEREKETEQTLKLMFDLGYVKPDEVPQIPKLAKTPGAILICALG
jgi:hypothetical protein